jgi:hypothetical protein
VPDEKGQLPVVLATDFPKYTFRDANASLAGAARRASRRGILREASLPDGLVGNDVAMSVRTCKEGVGSKKPRAGCIQRGANERLVGGGRPAPVRGEN